MSIPVASPPAAAPATSSRARTVSAGLMAVLAFFSLFASAFALGFSCMGCDAPDSELCAHVTRFAPIVEVTMIVSFVLTLINLAVTLSRVHIRIRQLTAALAIAGLVVHFVALYTLLCVN